MAIENAKLNYGRRVADAYAPSGRARPAWQPYEPPRRAERDAAPVSKNEADYHPVIALKTLTPAELRAIVLVIFVVTAVAMGIISLAAQATVAQKEINDLKRNIAQTDDDIANLKIEIEQAKNMESVKQRAQDELGLRAPAFDQRVYVSDLPEAGVDFGEYIKGKAYGGTSVERTEQESEPASE